LWRLSFPEVVEDNDRPADLHRVANYLAGAKLPPIDYWLPYQRFNYYYYYYYYYYTFQHYSAALLGRLFGLGPGESFTLAFPLSCSAWPESRGRCRLPLDGVLHHARGACRPLGPPLTAALRRRR